jgi:hypothetical protein
MATQLIHAIRIKNLARTAGLKKRLAEELRRELVGLSPIAENRLAEADDGSQVAYLVLSDLADNSAALNAIDGAYFDNVRLEAEPTLIVSARPDRSQQQQSQTHDPQQQQVQQLQQELQQQKQLYQWWQQQQTRKQQRQQPTRHHRRQRQQQQLQHQHRHHQLIRHN